MTQTVNQISPICLMLVCVKVYICIPAKVNDNIVLAEDL